MRGFFGENVAGTRPKFSCCDGAVAGSIWSVCKVTMPVNYATTQVYPSIREASFFDVWTWPKIVPEA